MKFSKSCPLGVALDPMNLSSGVSMAAHFPRAFPWLQKREEQNVPTCEVLLLVISVTKGGRPCSVLRSAPSDRCHFGGEATAVQAAGRPESRLPPRTVAFDVTSPAPSEVTLDAPGIGANVPKGRVSTGCSPTCCLPAFAGSSVTGSTCPRSPQAQPVRLPPRAPYLSVFLPARPTCPSSSPRAPIGPQLAQSRCHLPLNGESWRRGDILGPQLGHAGVGLGRTGPSPTPLWGNAGETSASSFGFASVEVCDTVLATSVRFPLALPSGMKWTPVERFQESKSDSERLPALPLKIHFMII